MPKKIAWLDLTHQERIRVLSDMGLDQIINQYEIPETTPEDFRADLANQLTLWGPKNLGEFQLKGGPPTKDVVFGAWRDLDRSEALLELIDNSIDAWHLRRDRYPAKTAKNLIIHISINPKTQQLVYEDNAGGVATDKLTHLVVPGYSDTTDLSPTIGSYKTGGKKAIFRLATAASITTRYQNPAETSDEAWSLQLDEAWLRDPHLYEFPYAPLKDKSVIEKGQTRYTFQLREEPVGGTPWYLESDDIKKVSEAIQRTYTLILIRNPNIQIFFHDLVNPIKPLEEMYDFSGTNKDGTDIRPQQMQFVFKLLHDGVPHVVTAEIVLGCRRTSGAGHDLSGPGIDLYGNDRLFVIHDQETFAHMLPGGSARNLVRGFVNIQGPNVFIPWDTHKRHLNPDREIMRALTKNKLITDFFGHWYEAYQSVGRGDVTDLISEPLPKAVDKSKKDLFFPTRVSVDVDLNRKRGVNLPTYYIPPKVNRSKPAKEALTVKFTIDVEETMYLFGKYGIEGSPSEPSKAVEQNLSEAIRDDVLDRTKKKRRK
jgi:Histidine kinase-, DNA gyrase B-, and HSP90-like ATPase